MTDHNGLRNNFSADTNWIRDYQTALKSNLNNGSPVARDNRLSPSTFSRNQLWVIFQRTIEAHFRLRKILDNEPAKNMCHQPVKAQHFQEAKFIATSATVFQALSHRTFKNLPNIRVGFIFWTLGFEETIEPAIFTARITVTILAFAVQFCDVNGGERV